MASIAAAAPFVRHCSRVILANSPLKTAFSREQATEVIGAERAE